MIPARWALVGALLGCADVQPLNTEGNIVCGEGGLCPGGFECRLGRCCPTGSTSCPAPQPAPAAGACLTNLMCLPGLCVRPGNVDTGMGRCFARCDTSCAPGLECVRIGASGACAAPCWVGNTNACEQPASGGLPLRCINATGTGRQGFCLPSTQ